MDITRFSNHFRVRVLTETDIPAILSLCRGNPLYYHHCPPAVSEESIRADMRALPPGKGPEDKYYLGFFDEARLVAVLDFIRGFPREEIAFWGFFMLDQSCQGRGMGSNIVSEVCRVLPELGFRAVRLGWVRGNPQAEHFWKKNGFLETGSTWNTNGYTVVYAQREI